MSRASRLLVSALALIALAVSAGAVDASGASASYTLTVPSSAQVETTTAIQLNLPAGVAAVNGRVYFNSNALEFIGVAPLGAGTALSPAAIRGGAAFAAYGLKPVRGANAIRLIVVPDVAGRIQLSVVIDAAASASGARLSYVQPAQSVALQSGTSTTGPIAPAPTPATAAAPVRAATATRTLVGQRVLTRRDLDTVTAAWQDAMANGTACSAASAAADANGDGCVDAVDIQAVSAGIGQAAAPNAAVRMVAPAAQLTSAQALAQAASPASGSDALKSAVAFSHTFTVTYAGDTADAHPGDGSCADDQGRCSLRAAMTESNWSNGADLINFNIPGPAPIKITIGSVLPFLNDTTGGTTIDGYTQPGSRLNTAQYGSNAIPGIAIKGTGDNPETNIFHITSSGNVVRGFALYGAYRIIGLSGTGATGNTIVGNWMGVTGAGAVAGYFATEDIYLDQGPSNNIIGTPALGDRNVLANAAKAIDMYGPGTNANVIQNNDFCMTPSGARSTCHTGVDHDFGPKSTQIGGFDANELNVIGPTTRNGVEISHGWDPNGQDTSTKWLNMDIHVEGNWIGFKISGSYNAKYRSGNVKPTSYDGNGVNVYDGCKDNVVDGNYIASVFDGVNTQTSNCFDNIIQNNIIGVSPKGQPAPMKWWGIHVRQGTYGTLIKNNTIRNAALGGIGLVTGNERTIEITRNIISKTSGPAIHLEPTSDTSAPGSNNLYAPPVITATSTTSVSGTGIAGATVEVYQASRSAGQSGLPIAYLGSGTVAGNGSWTVPVSIANNTQVTALEIAPNGNTSELGTNVDVGSGSQVLTITVTEPAAVAADRRIPT